MDAGYENLILIDDVRLMFASPPEKLRKPSDMPSFNDVIEILNSGGRRYSTVWRDVLISVPADREEAIYEFLLTQGDLMFFDTVLDFSKCGIGSIARCWKTALKGLPYVPGAILRSIKARI